MRENGSSSASRLGRYLALWLGLLTIPIAGAGTALLVGCLVYGHWMAAILVLGLLTLFLWKTAELVVKECAAPRGWRIFAARGIPAMLAPLYGAFIVFCVYVFTMSDSRMRAEAEHGIKLPPSARHLQCRGDAGLAVLDRGASTMFEMDGKDLAEFVAQLRITSRAAPVSTANADPLINGYNVWPQDSPTAVPGNAQYGGFRPTWERSATPVEMLSCESPTGDWLHVELWRLERGSMLVKMYTDWN